MPADKCGKIPRCALFLALNTWLMAGVSLCILYRRVFWALRLSTAYTDSTDMASSSLDQFFVPPEAVRGSKVLNRAAFRREFELPAVCLAQPQLCSSFLKRLAHARLKSRNIIKEVLTEQSEDGKVRCGTFALVRFMPFNIYLMQLEYLYCMLQCGGSSMISLLCSN